MNKLKIPYYKMEEHNEAFYYWGLAIEKGYIQSCNNILFHIDHHDDFESGAYFHDFTQSFSSLAERRSFTYDQLGIADFIVPALYERIFDKFYNMKKLVNIPFSEQKKVIILKNNNILSVQNYIPFLHSQAQKDNNPNFAFFTQYTGSLSPTPPLSSVVLDIDLDYFCWDDALTTANPKLIELTHDAYKELQSNPYHPFRILPRQLLRPIEIDGHFYLKYEEPPLNSREVSDATIVERVRRFTNWLANQPWTPSLITICRSVHSGYLPRDKANLVESLVYQSLETLWSK